MSSLRSRGHAESRSKEPTDVGPPYAKCRSGGRWTVIDPFFGVLHSRAHEVSALANSPRHGDGSEGGRPTYSNLDCFENFPFPWPPGTEPGETEDPRIAEIAEASRALVALRSDIAVHCCITKAPCGGERSGRSPVDRGKGGIKRSVAVDADGIPLGSAGAPANRHDSPLLPGTLDSVEEILGTLPEPARVHLDRGYDSDLTRKRLAQRDLIGVISEKGKPSSLRATNRWVVERTDSWQNAHKKLVWCTEREGRVIDFWMAFSNVIIIVGRLIRKAWTRYRWESRPSRRP